MLNLSTILSIPIMTMTCAFRSLLNTENPVFETMSTIVTYTALHKIADMQSQMATTDACKTCTDFWPILSGEKSPIMDKLISAKNLLTETIFCNEDLKDKTGSFILVVAVVTPVLDLIGKTFLGISPPKNVNPIVRVGFAAMLTGTQFILTRSDLWE